MVAVIVACGMDDWERMAHNKIEKKKMENRGIRNTRPQANIIQEMVVFVPLFFVIHYILYETNGFDMYLLHQLWLYVLLYRAHQHPHPASRHKLYFYIPWT